MPIPRAVSFSAPQKLSRNHLRERPAPWVTPITCQAPGTAQQKVCTRPWGSMESCRCGANTHAGGANGGEGPCRPGPRGAHGSGSVVAGAATTGVPAFRPVSSAAREVISPVTSGDSYTLAKRAGVDVQLLQDFLAPAAAGHVPAAACRRRRETSVAELAGVHVAHIVLGQAECGRTWRRARAGGCRTPQNLRGGKAVKAGLAVIFNQPLLAHPLGDSLALGGGALVAPDDGAAQQVALLVQHHQARASGRRCHRLNLLVGDAALFDNGP